MTKFTTLGMIPYIRIAVADHKGRFPRSCGRSVLDNIAKIVGALEENNGGTPSTQGALGSEGESR